MWPGPCQMRNIHSFERKALEAEDPTEAETGTGKEHVLFKGLCWVNHLCGFGRTEA